MPNPPSRLAIADRLSSSPVSGIAGAALATLAWGASGVIAKGIDMGGLAIVAYRFSMAAIVFFVVIAFTRSAPSVRQMIVLLPAGIALAVDTALFFSAVKETTVANATVIGALQPVLMLGVARRFLGERVVRSQIWWSVIAVAGTVFVIFGATGVEGSSLLGDALAVGALFFWTWYLYLIKALRNDHPDITTLQLSAAVALYTGVIMVPVALLFGQDLSWPDTESWLFLALMAFGSGLLAHPLMNWALSRIPVSLGSAMVLLVPISASILAWAFLGERITVLQLAGAAIVLTALGALTRLHSTVSAEDQTIDHVTDPLVETAP